MSKKRRRPQEDEGNENAAKKQQAERSLPAGVKRYQRLADVPWDAQHYWKQRFKLFSKYNEGILMTDDAWFGVTQENVANKIAEDVAKAASPERKILIDAFCGVGGNTIAFARSGRWSRVYAIEKDWATLECARNNAKVYGVHDKITWFHGDCFELLGASKENKDKAVRGLRELVTEFGVVFGSPPWGGPTYKDYDIFDLSAMEPYSLETLYQGLGSITTAIALYLPRTSDLNQLAKIVDPGKKASVVHYCTDGGSRALCAYLGGGWGPMS